MLSTSTCLRPLEHNSPQQKCHSSAKSTPRAQQHNSCQACTHVVFLGLVGGTPQQFTRTASAILQLLLLSSASRHPLVQGDTNGRRGLLSKPVE